MNCPKCETYMHLVATFYPHLPGRVYECTKCRERYTEKELEEGPLCAGCGEPVVLSESICKHCEAEMYGKIISYE